MDTSVGGAHESILNKNLNVVKTTLPRFGLNIDIVGWDETVALLVFTHVMEVFRTGARAWFE